MKNEKCKEMVSGEGRWGSFHRHQCSFKAVKDGYCKIHHPDTVAKRQKKSEENHKKRMAQTPLALARTRVIYLEDLLRRNNIKF